MGILVDLIERRKAFGNWLAKQRKQAGLTQASLAQALGLETAQLISNIERGESLLPSHHLPEVARQLKCALLELEIRYFSCSSRHNEVSRMPELLIKYLPLLNVLESGSENEAEILEVIAQIKNA